MFLSAWIDLSSYEIVLGTNSASLNFENGLTEGTHHTVGYDAEFYRKQAFRGTP